MDEYRAVLGSAVVGIVGLGGLGSNVAWMLLRAGVRHFVLADSDRVEADNLTRQYYYPEQIGEWKTVALAASLTHIDPAVDLVLVRERIDPAGLLAHFGAVDVLIEAVDTAEDKAMLIDACAGQMPGMPLIGASGIAGLDPAENIVPRQLTEDLWIVGDLTSDASEGLPLVCPRVVTAAAHQAHLAIRLLLASSDA